jgi:hypothetical protein
MYILFESLVRRGLPLKNFQSSAQQHRVKFFIQLCVRVSCEFFVDPDFRILIVLQQLTTVRVIKWQLYLYI